MKQSSSLTAITVFLLFLVVIFSLPPWIPKKSYFGVLKNKLEILKHTPSPKIILVGGSNVAYGIDSNILEKKLKYPVVNMGFVFSTGLRYNLELVKDEIKDGDIVVLSPEYGTLSYLVNGDCVSLEIAEVNPFSLGYVLRTCLESNDYAANLLRVIVFYPGKKFRDIHTLLGKISTANRFDPIMLKPEGGRKYFFDRHGDYFLHLIYPTPEANYLCYQDPVTCISEEAAQLLNQFNSFVLSHNAKVVLIPPPHPLTYPPFLKLVYEDDNAWPCRKINMPILAKPQRYRFPLSDFYEVPYHLNLNGRAKRTTRMSEDLKRYLDKLGLTPYH